MLISELQDKLEKVKQELGDVEVYMECWDNIDTNYVCIVKNEYDNSFEVRITDNIEGLAQVFDIEDFELIREV